MGKVIENYRIKIYPQSPIHIGSGKTYGKNEYVFLKKDKMILIPDLHKLFHIILSNDLSDDYRRFMEKNGTEAKLGEWLEKSNIDVSKDAEWVRYSMKLSDEAAENFSLMEIQACIKDAYGNPYIPGSSLKGAIRTAILGARVSQNGYKINKDLKSILEEIEACTYDNVSSVNKLTPKKRPAEATLLEQREFCCLGRNKEKKWEATNDYMAAIRISDSKPLHVNDLILCQKIDRMSGNIIFVNRINTMRESIWLSEPIEFRMSLDLALVERIGFLKKGKNHSSALVEMMRKSIESFSEIVSNDFTSIFGETRKFKNTIYLGGGTGFVSKTVIYPLLGKEQGRDVTSKILHKEFRKNGKHDQLDSNVSPHMLKCTNISGGIQCQMGLCKIEITKE